MSFYKKLNSLCAKNGTSVTAVAVALGYSGSSATTWKNSKGMPRSSTVKKIADYFSVPVDYFYDVDMDTSVQNNNDMIVDDHTPVSIKDSESLTDQEKELLNIFRSLSVIEQAKLLVSAAELKEKISKV